MLEIDQLQNRYSIREKIYISELKPGFPLITLANGDYARARISLYGAQIISWVDASRNEKLFHAGRLIVEKGSPIRAGVPIIFPQFGAGPLPAHGFARVLDWNINMSGVTTDGSPFVELSLQDSDYTRSLWPFNFSLSHLIRLDQSLTSVLKLTNNSPSPISTQLALHSYFKLKSLSALQIRGLNGTEFIDSVKGGVRLREDRENLTIDGYVNRIYCNPPSPLHLIEEGAFSGVRIDSENLPDVVVWNPGAERTPTFKDLVADDYKSFVCVERGAVDTHIHLDPGTSLILKQSLSSI